MPRKNKYVFTLNNWRPADRLRLEAPDNNVTYMIFGEEVGDECGTPHLQGYLELRKEENMSVLNPRLFDNRAHLEIAKGNAEQNKEYCSKGENVYERGEPRSGKKGTRSDLDDVHAAINGGKTYDEICDDFFGTVSRCDRFIRDRIAARDRALAKEQLTEAMSQTVLWTWQNRLLNVLTGAPHPRHVLWYWESQGGKGKSFMARYLMVTQNCLVLEAGRKLDLVHILTKQVPFPSIVVFDLARTTAADDDNKNRLDAVYSLMESLKNGYVISTKYDATELTFKPPHVVAFANYEPDLTKMSEDRWVVVPL